MPKNKGQGLKTERLDPLNIQLDPRNPRLTEEEEGSTQDQLIKIMVERFKLEELAESIAATGFLNFDPLIATREDATVTILEGNRRIAAVKLLLKPNFAPENARDVWRELSEKLSKKHRDAMKRLDVIVYPSRESADLTAYMGFRHVTGVLQWPALEKANFISQLVEKDGWNYKKIADKVGSYPRHVERHYVAHQIVKQATELNIDTRNVRTNAFGVLMRALQARGVAEFLGLKYPGDPKKSRKPITKSHLENLQQFFKWTFGTPDEAPVLRDSRQLTKWGRILQSPNAIGYLKRASYPTFERAYLKSGGQTESLVEALATAADRLEESVPLVSDHTDDSEVRTWVERCAKFLSMILAHFPKLRKEFSAQSPNA